MASTAPFASPWPSAPAPLTAGQLLRFSAIAVPLMGAAMPVAVYLPAIYARHFGLSLAAIGAIFLAGQALNVLLDPLVGALSDRSRSRFGRRRPWIAAGGTLFAIGGALLFFPPAAVSTGYLAAGLLTFYLGCALVQTPFLAWSGEISGEYHQRTRVTTYYTVVQSVALFVALLLPTLADQLQAGNGRLQLTLMGGFLLATTLPGLLLTLTAARETAPTAAPEPFSLRQSLRAVLANPLLLRVLASDVAVRAGQGTRAALMVFFVAIYLQRPQWAAGLFLFQYVFGILAGPIWLGIGRRLGKHRAAVLAELIQVAINLGLVFATPDRFGLVLALALAQGLAQGSGNLMLRAMVADIADQHRHDTGEERTGLFCSVFSLAEKAGGAIAIGVALPLVAWLGFDPKAAVNGAQALDGLLLVFALGPALGHALSAAVLVGFPLDESAHSRIRRQLDDGPTVAAPAE